MLSAPSQALLLRNYFTTSLEWWVARGRPSLDIASFFTKTTASPSVPGPHPTPSSPTFPSPDALTPNPWLALVQSALVYPDDHLCKLQRSLAHNASLYGNRSAGSVDFSRTELAGAELLDGSLFARAASLTADAMGWVREGQEAVGWSRDGFYADSE